MLAGTAGTHGSARGRMTILAAVIGLIAGFLIAGAVGALAAAVGAVLGCIVLSDLVYGASRREGSGGGALAFFVALAAVVVIAVALFLEPAGRGVRLGPVLPGVSPPPPPPPPHPGARGA